MGTNYYHRTNICSECGRYDERHIGESSDGWQFIFRGYTREPFSEKDFVEIRSFKQWSAVLETGEIWNKHEGRILWCDFLKLIFEKSGERRNHAREYGEDSWMDEEGYSFSGYEFS